MTRTLEELGGSEKTEASSVWRYDFMLTNWVLANVNFVAIKIGYEWYY